LERIPQNIFIGDIIYVWFDGKNIASEIKFTNVMGNNPLWFNGSGQ
jgi:hypothetical protein